MYSRLPSCLEKIELAFELKSLSARRAAATACWPLAEGDTHGAVLEDVRLQVNNRLADFPLIPYQSANLTLVQLHRSNDMSSSVDDVTRY